MASSKNTLRSASTSVVMNERNLDVLCASFTDRDLVVVTEFQKLGTLISVMPSRPCGTGLVSYDINVIMGNEELEHHVFARAIAEVVFKLSARDDLGPAPNISGKPLLCTLALSEFSPSLLSTVCDMVKQCNVWNS